MGFDLDISNVKMLEFLVSFERVMSILNFNQICHLDPSPPDRKYNMTFYDLLHFDWTLSTFILFISLNK